MIISRVLCHKALLEMCGKFLLVLCTLRYTLLDHSEHCLHYLHDVDTDDSLLNCCSLTLLSMKKNGNVTLVE